MRRGKGVWVPLLLLFALLSPVSVGAASPIPPGSHAPVTTWEALPQEAAAIPLAEPLVREGIVLPRGPESFDSLEAAGATVLVDDGGYKMWYHGADGATFRIAYATSPDGRAWTKHGVVMSSSGWDGLLIAFPEVLKIGGEYWMWYSGFDGNRYRIYAANSTDGRAWVKLGLVLDVGPGADYLAALDPSVTLRDGVLFMWYTGRAINTPSSNRLLLATSVDRLMWTKRGVVMGPGPSGAFDEISASGPAVRLVGGRFEAIYTGQDRFGKVRLGFAHSHDGLAWNRAGLALDVGPVGEDQVVGFPSLVVADDGSWLVYYQGRGTAYATFLATRPVPGLLRATTAIDVHPERGVPATIRVDGVPRDEWGLAWLKLAPATYRVSFSDVPGFGTPEAASVNVSSGTVSEVRGAYRAHGSLRVMTDPPVPATIFVDGVPRNEWGIWMAMPPGTYEISFGPLPGFVAPEPQLVTVEAESLTEVVGRYVVEAGSPGPDPSGYGLLRVETRLSDGRVGVPSQILVNRIPRDEWGLNWLKIEAGVHTVSFTDIPGLGTPSPVVVEVSTGGTTQVIGTFQVHGSLRITTDPPVPGTITVDGIPRNDWGVWQSFAPGTHTVSFGFVFGYISPPEQTLTVLPGATASIVGTYQARPPSNTPPVAAFTVDSLDYVSRTVSVNASLAWDWEDSASALELRWNFGDGSPTTEWSRDRIETHAYAAFGTYSIRLEVRDGGGTTGAASQAVPFLSSDPHTLPFRIADAAFHPTRPYAYVSDGPAHRVLFVDLVTGLIDREFRFRHTPEHVALTPDGSRLFVGLLTRPHDSQWIGTHTGYVGTFDTTAGSLESVVAINEDPFDLVATGGGQIVVSSGSGQWTALRAYDARTLEQTGEWTLVVFMGMRLALHPSERIVYGAENNIHPNDLRRYDLSPEGGLTFRWDSPYHGEHRMDGNLWIVPSGEAIITRGGDVFTSGANRSEDLLFVRSLSAGLINDVALDAVHNLLLSAEGSVLRFYNLSSYDEMGAVSLGAAIRFVRAYGDTAYALTDVGGSTQVVIVPGATSNAPPTARFTVSPRTGDTDTIFEFDASRSTDDEDPVSALSFRWDLNGDGTWDTSFSPSRTATSLYDTGGKKMVRLQVKDSLGWIGEAETSFEVAFAVDRGSQGPKHPPYGLPYPTTDVAFDKVHGFLYTSDKANRKVYFVNLLTGKTERQFDFRYMPESLALAPDASRLYVALLTREHSSYWEDSEGHIGFIASFDLETQLKDRMVQVAADPFDFTVLADGRLVVSSGSGAWTFIRIFDAMTGALLARTSETVLERMRIALHPSGTALYAADSGIYPDDLFRFDLLPDGRIVDRWDSPYHGEHRMGGNLWISPRGDVVVSRGGDIFSVGDTRETDLIFLRSLASGSISDLVFDISAGLIFTAEGSALRSYDSIMYGSRGSVSLPGPARFLGLVDATLYAIIAEPTETIIERVRLPMG